MKYEVEIDPSDSNTSHHLMLELVGTDKRVLDVGCATGYLARALVAQGCTVSGVEVDPEAAEEARPVLKDLVVGNLEALDLTEAFGERMFDAVVFGDVLEHLTDPLKVLRASIGLLDDGGFIVVSIPNVAHGSVRLALLKGKFEYRSLGLLDSTHLRFFTRESFDALLRDAELMPVDFRRTTAGFFETEIRVREEEYPPGLLAALNEDPEGRTYQFVVKAIPLDSSPALRRLYEENAQQKSEVTRLRRILDAVRSAGYSDALPVQIGVWGHFGLDDLRSALLSRIVPGELARRFPAGTVRCFAPGASPVRIDAGGPIESLGPWSQARAQVLAAELDAVVVTGPLGVPPSAYRGVESHDRVTELDSVLFQGLGADLEEVCPVLCVGVELYDQAQVSVDRVRMALAQHRYLAVTDPRLEPTGPDAATDPDPSLVPDPLFLAGRFFDPESLRLRAAYLRLMGWYPATGPVIVVQGDRDLVDFSSGMASVLDEIATETGARCVLLESRLIADEASFANAVAAELKLSGGVLPIDAGLTDLLAAMANAEVVIASSPSLLAAAFSLGRPCIGLDLKDTGRMQLFAQTTGTPDAIVRKPTEIAASLKHSPSQQVIDQTVQKLQRQLDQHFDQMATTIAEVSRTRRSSNDGPLASLSAATQLKAVQSAHGALERRVASERLAFADRAAAFERQAQDNLRHAMAAAAEAEARLEALYATRTLRTLRPVRQLYARLRSQTR